MAHPNSRPTGEHVVIADGEPLELRSRHLAALLAWLIPGAGHAYQRRYVKSAIFFVCITSSFLFGLLMSGGNCVYAAWNTTETRWQYVLQAGIGLPALPAAYQYYKQRNNQHAFWGSFMAAPESEHELDKWHKETASGFDMGTLYTMIAGLLNVLVIFDAYAGPLPPPIPKKKRSSEAPDEPADGDGSPSSSSGAPS